MLMYKLSEVRFNPKRDEIKEQHRFVWNSNSVFRSHLSAHPDFPFFPSTQLLERPYFIHYQQQIQHLSFY